MTARKKPVAKSRIGRGTKQVNTDDPLADLGLDSEPARPVLAGGAKINPATATKPEVKETTETASHEEVEVGDLEFGFSPFIPTATRKAEGSKYKFASLPAPSVFEDGPYKGKPKIANFTVRLQPGVDQDKLRRSVQSATTQANKQSANEGKYFVSRSLTDKEGKFVGMVVYRTDDRPKK